MRVTLVPATRSAHRRLTVKLAQRADIARIVKSEEQTMKLTKRSLYRLLLLALALLGIIGLGILISGQEAPKQGMPLIDDWSAHHLVFSNPGTAAEAQAQGRLEQWNRIVNDPRYIMQQLKRSALQRALGPAPDFATLAGQLSAPVGDQLSIPKIPPVPARKLKKDWSMDFGLTSAASTGTVGALNSSTISGSSTVTVSTVAFHASAPTAATQTGTFSVVPTAYNNPAITITNTSPANVLSLTTNATGAYTTGTFAQAPTSSIAPYVTSNSVVTNFKTNATASSATGTFSTANPPSSAQITIGSGVNTLTLSNGGTARTVTGTFNTPVWTSTSIGITSNSGTLTMTPGGTAQTAAGTFSAVAASTGNGITITNGTKVLTLKPGGTGQTLAGTFTSVPGLTSNPIVITSNSSTMTMTPGGTAQTAAGTFTNVAVSTSNPITITNGAKVLTMNPGGTGQTLAATFTAVPVTTSNPLVITSNSSTLTMTPGGTAANAVGTFAGTLTTNITVTSGTVVTTITPTGVGTETFSTEPAVGDTTTIGNVTYTWAATCGTASYCITRHFTPSSDASGLASAINGTCGGSGTCSTQTGIAATYSGTVTTITNTTASSVNFSLPVNTSNNTISPASGGITAAATVACTGSGNAYSGSFIGSGTLGTEQSNLLSLLQGCPAGAGFTVATGGTNAVQVSYPAPGSFTGATLTGAGNVTGIFTWVNTAGTAGSATCTGAAPTFSGTFVNSNVANTLAGNFRTALNQGTCAANVGYSAPAAVGAVETLTDLVLGASASVGAFSGSGGNGVSWVNNNGTDLGAATCTGSGPYTGTFVNSNVASTLAANFYNALVTGSCATNVGYSVPSPSGAATVTVTDLYLGTGGNVGTFTGAAGNGVTWTNNVGTTGSATCTGSAPTFSGTFVNSNVNSTLATNFYNALNAGTCPADFGYSAPTPSGAVETLTDLVVGTSAAVGAFSGSGGNGVTWSNPGAGTNLTTPTCTGSSNTWTGTFVNSNVANTLALNFYNALIASSNACTTGVGYSVPAPGAATVTLSDLTPGASATIGATFSGANGNGVGWVNTAGTDGTQNTCSGSSSTYTGTFINNSSTTTLAGNFNTAIGVCAASVGFSASPSTNTVVVTNIASGTGVPLSVSGGTSGPFTWGTPSAGSNGTTNGCSNSTTGVFETSTSTATLANNLQLAISSCNTTYPLVGATASYTATTSYFTVTETALGAGSFGVSNAPGFSWGTPTIGSNGTGPTCTGSSPYTANYVVAQTLAQLAQNLVAAINACPTGADIVATYTNGGSFTVANSTFGSGTGTLSSAGGVTNVLTFTATTAGSAGTAACNNTTGTYVYNATLSTLATNLNTAIGDCAAATTGVTSSTSGAPTNGIKLTSYTPGTTGASGITLGGGGTVFGWTASTLSGGTDGTTSGTASPPTFQYWSGDTYLTQAEVATNIATAINQNTTTNTKVSAVAGGDVVVVTALAEGTGGNTIAVSAGAFSALSWNPATDLGGGGLAATVGEGQYPAVFSFSASTANCASATPPDFAAYNTGVPGSSSQASIIAFFNIYTGCSTTTYPVPAPYWAYNTGGTILTSVALSNDGTQLAFVHSSAAGSSLVLLHWKAGEGASAGSGSAAASPATPATTTTDVSSWVSCRGGTPSCQLDLPFSGTTANVTRSAPYYDTFNDQLYVGDDQGVLHKFTGVFRGTPGEVTTGGWPITVNSGTVLTGAVNDANTNNVFVGDSSGVLSYVLDTGSITGTCSSSGSSSPPCLGSPTVTLTTGPIADGPLVDPSAETVFAFSGVVSKNPAAYEVLQSNESLSTSSSITFSGVTGNTYTSNARIGAFDNSYYTNGPSAGHLYVCAPNNDGSTHYNGAALYSIGFTSGVMNTSTTGGPLDMVSASPASGSTVDDCSPLTEFYNGTTDYLFVGVAENGALAGCTGTTTAGCLYNFNINSFPSGSVTGLAVTGNTSGIVIDNNVTTPVTGSQIYFTNLASQTCNGNTKTGNAAGGCATQASQSSP